MTKDDSAIKITTWNVRGLGKLSKLKQVMTRLKHLNSAVIFLQESHLMSCDLLKVKRRWSGQVYSASFSTNSRGVITLIHKSLPFQVTNTISDPAGRYLIMQGSLFKENITLVNLYGPMKTVQSFLKIFSFYSRHYQGNYSLVVTLIAQSRHTLIVLLALTWLIHKPGKYCSIL